MDYLKKIFFQKPLFTQKIKRTPIKKLSGLLIIEFMKNYRFVSFIFFFVGFLLQQLDLKRLNEIKTLASKNKKVYSIFVFDSKKYITEILDILTKE